MLDRLSKRVLKNMNSQPNPGQKKYFFEPDMADLAKTISVDTEILRSAIRYLEEQKYIAFFINQHGRNLGFYLDHKGLHLERIRSTGLSEICKR